MATQRPGRERRMKEKRSREVIEFLERLPEGRRIYLNLGALMVEVSKEEALEFLRKQEEEEKGK